jgi:hypothetical protein
LEFGIRTLDGELVVEFLDNDELYPVVKYGRILKISFSDAANQGDRVRDIAPGPEWMKGVSFEFYPIDVILSGSGWERKISNVPVRRIGATGLHFKLLDQVFPIFFGKGVHVSLGLSSPGLDVYVINFGKTESVTGGIGGYANIGFGDYLKLLPNIGWNVSLGMETLNFENSNGSDSGVGLLFLGLDARLLFQYKMVTFSLGQIIHLESSGNFKPVEGKPELLTKKVFIPAQTSLLMGINFSF